MLSNELVHVRTPTYRRPVMLRRALESLINQTWSNWICDVYDDDPDAAGREVCASLNDDRIRYNHNSPQNFASKNIDQCFTKKNPHSADFFFVLEDDNFVFERFIEENIELCHLHNVNVVLRNQVIETASGTENARLSDVGVLNHLFKEGLYPPERFRLSLITGIGVSNGGLFWSRHTKSTLEIGVKCTATAQEYLRTYAISEPVYVAMTPLAAWAENAEQTTRNAEIDASYLKRELDLKRCIQSLQRLAWLSAGKNEKENYITNEAFRSSISEREYGLLKSFLIGFHQSHALTFRAKLKAMSRGLLIRVVGKNYPEFYEFLSKVRHPTIP
ncbi:glycosyltransferase family 2 protein [Rhizobium sp. CG4]|jgi:glycosyltransferase involved in cell wall biosynthesis|uniref:glycosyltransferase family 2 protein n=1 Tax=Rhizobium/Agrobacterium group TaxID=227290 RepID=UPI0021675133|nr:MULTISPECIES: glycosyltransferase [Rhizobium/Agrobacterium group]MCM2458096.1 glycosyltransferase family 2 protein [Rhizobium sp. CG4]MDO5897964.1 glycosyltransferase [Agrobacterium sp. Azo12]